MGSGASNGLAAALESVTAVDIASAFASLPAETQEKLQKAFKLTDPAGVEDPRLTLARFFQSGDARGPRGCIENPDGTPITDVGGPRGGESSWFVVFRPTSDVAIETMVSGIGCGKCLEVKGKSALSGPMSGRVPLLQISDNAHKKALATPSKNSRLEVFYMNEDARTVALTELTQLLHDMQGAVAESKETMKQLEAGKITLTDEEEADMYEKLKYEMVDPQITVIDQFQSVFGLEMPERLLMECYVHRKDITHPPGWETGRKSVAAFMNMNLHALHDSDRGNNINIPHATLLQADLDNPMNPHGLVMSYAAEGRVQAVVSDFDCFLIGSRGMPFEEIVPEQVDIAKWMATHTANVLETPGEHAWSFRWLDILKSESEKGFHPEIPKFGFGDPTSDAIMQQLATAMTSTGGVRHGAECFNFYFPQELDKEYLIVWSGYGGLEDRPWKYVNEPDLRAFLMDRIADEFSFPVNPCWPMRDPGWHEVLQALRANPVTNQRLQSWFPPAFGILDMIDTVHAQYPGGFAVVRQDQSNDMDDNDAMESADLAQYELKRFQTLKRAKRKLKMMLLLMNGARKSEGAGNAGKGYVSNEPTPRP